MTAKNECDYLHGAEQIANFLGVSKRRAFYLLESGQIPAGRLGGRWLARRSALATYIEALEQPAVSARGGERDRGSA